MAEQVQEAEVLARCASAWAWHCPGALLSFLWLNVVVQSLIQLLVIMALLDRHGTELADLGREQRHPLIEALSKAVECAPVVAALACRRVDSEADDSHREDAVSLGGLVDLDDCCLQPLVRIILCIDQIILFQSLLPLPDGLGLALKRSQLDGPPIEHSVGGSRLEQVLQGQRVAIHLGDLGLGPAGSSAASGTVIIMEQGINLIAFLEFGPPRLPRALGEQPLQLLLRDLVVPPVQRAIVVEDLPACEKEFWIVVSSLQGRDEEIQEGFQKASACLKILIMKKLVKTSISIGSEAEKNILKKSEMGVTYRWVIAPFAAHPLHQSWAHVLQNVSQLHLVEWLLLVDRGLRIFALGVLLRLLPRLQRDAIVSAHCVEEPCNGEQFDLGLISFADGPGYGFIGLLYFSKW